MTLCKDSVYEFRDFIQAYVPEETIIHDTAHVDNIFHKKEDEEEEEVDDTLVINEDDLPEAKLIKEEIKKEEDAKKFPKPLFVLDLVPGKTGSLLPNYSTK